MALKSEFGSILGAPDTEWHAAARGIIKKMEAQNVVTVPKSWVYLTIRNPFRGRGNYKRG